MLWALLLIWLALVVAWLAMLVDATRQPYWAWEEAGRGKVLTVVLICLTGWIGAAYYYFAVRGSVVDAVRRGPSHPPRSDDDDWTPPAR